MNNFNAFFSFFTWETVNKRGYLWSQYKQFTKTEVYGYERGRERATNYFYIYKKTKFKCKKQFSFLYYCNFLGKSWSVLIRIFVIILSINRYVAKWIRKNKYFYYFTKNKIIYILLNFQPAIFMFNNIWSCCKTTINHTIIKIYFNTKKNNNKKIIFFFHFVALLTSAFS